MTSKQIMKPMSVARYEFIEDMTNLINASMLPPFVIEAVLKDMHNDIRILSQKQFETDLKNYRKSIGAPNGGESDTPTT